MKGSCVSIWGVAHPICHASRSFKWGVSGPLLRTCNNVRLSDKSKPTVEGFKRTIWSLSSKASVATPVCRLIAGVANGARDPPYRKHTLRGCLA